MLKMIILMIYYLKNGSKLTDMETIKKYFPLLTHKQLDSFEKLYGLYSEWNSKINVISRKDIENLYLHHVLHSLAIAKVIQFKEGTTILDVGTGGGFPGIPLAILFPDCQLHLVDSIGKKIKVVNEIVNSLELQNVTTEVCRAENLKSQFDFIVSRAVTSLPIFHSWVENKITDKNKNNLNNGVLYLKGGNIEQEIIDLHKIKCSLFKISNIFKLEYFADKFVVHIYQ